LRLGSNSHCRQRRPSPDAREQQRRAVDSSQTENHRRYWRKNQTAIGALLLVWFAVTFGVSFFARDLSFVVFGWPFSFWMAAQGAPLVYGCIIGFYAWYMNRLDTEHGVHEEAD
jgi:putative solute:sodium symporter small subunit